jgi:hypothetical protein
VLSDVEGRVCRQLCGADAGFAFFLLSVLSTPGLSDACGLSGSLAVVASLRRCGVDFAWRWQDAAAVSFLAAFWKDAVFWRVWMMT